VDRNEPGESYRRAGAFSKFFSAGTRDLSSQSRTQRGGVGGGLACPLTPLRCVRD